ncbi:hypothetical protein [Bifidobacterium crudilactis]|jgi:hypothetical protein|uniref:hypothetical protein n=1 Tax=Bifidobacterium crudilactis TaxID=327277 RepID=UPI0023526BDE|nr:hypothetical protein [Bifidobacterium crudilactis]MCI1868278.1 hypothetical protein [Bifidobacterium crudilactis]
MPTNSEQEHYDRIATFCKSLDEHPGEWNLYPYPFPNQQTAKQFIDAALAGQVDAFRVDTSLFRWRYSSLPLTTGVNIEMRVIA